MMSIVFWGIYYVTLRDLFYVSNRMIGNVTLVVIELYRIGHSRYVVVLYE